MNNIKERILELEIITAEYESKKSQIEIANAIDQVSNTDYKETQE